MMVESDIAVLIVEDHEDTAEMLRRYMTRHGLAAEVAGTGDEALDVLGRQRPRCVIVDETMPGMTGLELVRRLRDSEEHRDLPVVFYSAAFDWRRQAEAESLGASGWFIKGISRLDDLRSHVAGFCEA